MKKIEDKDYEYDVCLSFAGEDREYVGQVATILKGKGIRVFYDEYEEVELWGKDLYVHLSDVYSNAARYCVMFISEHYQKKLWTNHERQSAQERAFKENIEYILPVRFDETPVPGLRDTVGYLDISKKSPDALAELIKEKVGGHFKNNYFPPEPTTLYTSLNAEDDQEEQYSIFSCARDFFQNLKRMSEEEKDLIFTMFLNACPGELPENIHINLDLLRREMQISPSQILRCLRGMKSLGFEFGLRDDDETDGHIGNADEMLVVTWDNYERDDSTEIAFAMIQNAVAGHCENCAAEALIRLDFSQLCEATFEEDAHEIEGSE